MRPAKRATTSCSYLRACALGDAGPRAQRRPHVNTELLSYAVSQLNRVGNNLNQLVRRLNAAEAVGSFEASATLTETRAAIRGIIEVLGLS